jgi:hypothetical protein
VRGFVIKGNSVFLIVFLLLFASVVYGQELSPTVKQEGMQHALARARQATAKCEDEFGLLLAQAQATLKEKEKEIAELKAKIQNKE